MRHPPVGRPATIVHVVDALIDWPTTASSMNNKQKLPLAIALAGLVMLVIGIVAMANGNSSERAAGIGFAIVGVAALGGGLWCAAQASE